jgi:hypothetical protein
MEPDLMNGCGLTPGAAPDCSGAPGNAVWTPGPLGDDSVAMGYEAAVPWLQTGCGHDAVVDEWPGRDGG